MPPDFTCMIVDDERDALDFLATLIRENCPDLKIVATANSSDNAVKQFLKTQPDLIFMDIEVDHKTGFEIINEICGEKYKPHFIFVTGYNHYAVKAFKTNAIGYLLKPVDKEDLIKAVSRFTANKESELHLEKLWQFVLEYSGKIRFNTATGFILLHYEEILWCEADHNYSKITTKDGKLVMVSLNLASVEDKMPTAIFQRISRSMLINTRYLISVHRRNKTCTLRWSDQEIVLQASPDMLKKL